MEYAHQNSPGEKEIIYLQANDMVVISDKIKRTIPYTDITEIKLIKRRDLYFNHISTLNDKTILTTSQTIGRAGDRINQSKDLAFVHTMLFFLLSRCTTLASFLFLTEEYILRYTRKSISRKRTNTFIWHLMSIRFATKSMAKVR